MNVDLYAQLHGLAHAMHHAEEEKEGTLERDIQAYADSVVEIEKAKFQGEAGWEPGGLETLETHTSRVRQQVVHAMHEYCDIVERGYKAICDAIEAAGETVPEVTDEHLKIFGDIDAFIQAQNEGRAIYEMVGFSFETMTRFYTALDGLFQQGEYEKVRDGFYFMITICSKTDEYRTVLAHYWRALGSAETRLERYDKAEEAFHKAIALDPTAVDGYLGCLNVYEKQDMFTEADALCDEGIAHAEEHSDAAWSSGLKQTLVTAKQELKADTKEEL